MWSFFRVMQSYSGVVRSFCGVLRSFFGVFRSCVEFWKTYRNLTQLIPNLFGQVQSFFRHVQSLSGHCLKLVWSLCGVFLDLCGVFLNMFRILPDMFKNFHMITHLRFHLLSNSNRSFIMRKWIKSTYLWFSLALTWYLHTAWRSQQTPYSLQEKFEARYKTPRINMVVSYRTRTVNEKTGHSARAHLKK